MIARFGTAGHYSRTQYGAKFRHYMGGRVRDMERKCKGAAGIYLPARRTVLERLVKTGDLTSDDLEWAVENPTSHLPEPGE